MTTKDKAFALAGAATIVNTVTILVLTKGVMSKRKSGILAAFSGVITVAAALYLIYYVAEKKKTQKDT
jgi:hypothetical protein